MRRTGGHTSCVMHMLCTFVALLMLSGCHMSELTYDYHPFCEVGLYVDWSCLEEPPKGMTAMFYPQDGGEVVKHLSNDVHETTVHLREGIYNVILFNKDEGGFGTIGFKGMDKFQTARIHAVESSGAKGWYSKADNELVAAQPEPFAVAILTDFEVTEDMIHAQIIARSEAKAKSKSKTKAADTKVETKAQISLAPKNIISDGSIIVDVDGYHNLRSARGSITGMADNHILYAGKTGSEEVTHLLESWDKNSDESDYTKGQINCKFTSFGMPDLLLSRTDEQTWENAMLHIEVLLVDNKETRNFSFRIGDKIDISQETERITLNIELGEGIKPEPNPDIPPGEGEGSSHPIFLPNVKPEGSSSSGFDAEVSDWGQEVDIIVPL